MPSGGCGAGNTSVAALYDLSATRKQGKHKRTGADCFTRAVMRLRLGEKVKVTPWTTEKAIVGCPSIKHESHINKLSFVVCVNTSPVMVFGYTREAKN